jgi:hypothetical protein
MGNRFLVRPGARNEYSQPFVTIAPRDRGSAATGRLPGGPPIRDKVHEARLLCRRIHISPQNQYFMLADGLAALVRGGCGGST